MSLIKLRVELGALRAAVEDLYSAIQDHSKAIHAAQKAQREHDAIHESVPVLVSYDQQIEKDQKRQYNTQDSIAKWTKRAVIAASVYAAIAALQWYYMRRATLDAEDTAQRQFIAYALYSNSTGQISLSSDGRSYEAVVDIRNTGQTPAYNVETWADSIVRDKSLDPHADFQIKENTGPESTDLAAGEVLHIPITRGISGPALGEVRSGKKFIYIWGAVTYRDTFQKCQYNIFRLKNGEESKTGQWNLVAIQNGTTGPKTERGDGCMAGSEKGPFGIYGKKAIFFPN